MSQIKAIQFNGQQLPKGVDWDMMGPWVNTTKGEKVFIMPGDWLMGENGTYTEVLKNDEFLKRYSVEIIIKPKNQ